MGNIFDENNNIGGSDPLGTDDTLENNKNNSQTQDHTQQGTQQSTQQQSSEYDYKTYYSQTPFDYTNPQSTQSQTNAEQSAQQNVNTDTNTSSAPHMSNNENAFFHNQENSKNPYAQQGNYYQYPPYNNQQQQNQGAYPAYNAQNPYALGTETPKKRMSGGSKFLLVLLCASLIIASISIAFSLLDDDLSSIFPTENNDPLINGVENGPTLDFSDTPALESPTSPTGELAATDIYKKIYESSVGILVYSKDSQSLYTEGSGVIMGEDTAGEYTYIVTCAHVISDSGISIRIQIHDGSEYDAQIVGFDSRTDIGVIRVKISGLKAAEFGDSSKLLVGQTVYAIGNPGGTEFAGSFTAGMISAIDRPVSSSSSGYTMECIQHHAAINPGNSGGALVNGFGQVVGINSMKIVDDYEGMGFAVPSKVFQKVVDELISKGYVPNRPKLGIYYTPASAYRVYSMVVQIKGLPSGSIVIEEIAEDSTLNATEATIYDMIVAVNGEDMVTSDYLAAYIENSKVGDKLKLSIVRVLSDYSIKEFDVTVTLVEDKGTTSIETPEEETTPNYDYLFPFDF